MQVKEIMSKNPISVGPEDHVSHALSKMEKHKIHQLLVTGNGKLYGMLELKKIITRNIDISSSKVENFATNVPHIDANASLESAVQLLLSSALRAVPVTDDGNVVGIISETDLMKVAKYFVRELDKPVGQIAALAEYVEKKGNYGDIKKLFFEKNISRVPILDSNKVVGIVSTLEMIKILRGKETMESRGRNEKVAKEKLRMEEISATSVMRHALTVPENKPLSEVIELLKTNEEVLVSNGSLKIVTHKDILELFTQASQKGVYVQITGMQDESIEFKAKMDISVMDFVKKMSKFDDKIEYLVVHIDKMHKQGPKEKYSIRARFKSHDGFFVAHAWGWKPIDVIQEMFSNLEREAMHKHSKIRSDIKKSQRMKKGR